MTRSTDIAKLAQSAGLALDLPADLTVEEWRAVGEKLTLAGHRLQWWIGDWWAYGDRRYGDGAIKALPTGYTLGSVQNMGTVARAYAPDERRDDLSWSHHETLVAGLLPEERAKLLDRAASEGLTVRGLAKIVADYRAALNPAPPDEPSARTENSPLPGVSPTPIPARSTVVPPSPRPDVPLDRPTMPDPPVPVAAEPEPDGITAGLEAQIAGLRAELANARARIQNQDELLRKSESVPVWDRLVNDHSPSALAKTPDGRRIRDQLREFVAGMSAALDGSGGRRPNQTLRDRHAQTKGTTGGLVDPLTCPHPKDSEQVKSWGTVCGDCGRKIR